MESKPAIWLIASKETGKHIHGIFSEARLINPIKLIENESELAAVLQPGSLEPRLVLLDINLPDGTAWRSVQLLVERRLESRLIALVDTGSEALLDRAYGSGIKTYLRKGFSFPDFLERARALDLRFVLGSDRW